MAPGGSPTNPVNTRSELISLSNWLDDCHTRTTEVIAVYMPATVYLPVGTLDSLRHNQG
jgi:hypothetical protein